MAGSDATVAGIIEAELRQPVPEPARAIAAELARRHGTALVACLFYGSCLRDGVVEGRVLDFYAIAEDYLAFHGNRLAAAGNAVLPPNVYYLETASAGGVVRAKYAVVSLRHLLRDTSGAAFQSSLWGRLAQPCALVYVRDSETEKQVVQALATAVETMIIETAPLLPPDTTPSDLWVRAFSESYRTELRAERPGQSLKLYDAYSQRYDDLSGAVPHGSAQTTTRAVALRRWRARRLVGKLLHVLRLAKAAYTFSGGLDYILWKIETHSGVRTEPTAWQRRHPLMAAPGLAWRLYRRGAFK